MYKRGDYILFSMKGRIADEIHDPIHGECYIVECEGPGNPVIRIPAGSIDMRMRNISRERSDSMEVNIGRYGIPHRPLPPTQRMPSTPVDGIPQYWGELQEEKMHRAMTRHERDVLRRIGCPMPPMPPEAPEG